MPHSSLPARAAPFRDPSDTYFQFFFFSESFFGAGEAFGFGRIAKPLETRQDGLSSFLASASFRFPSAVGFAR